VCCHAAAQQIGEVYKLHADRVKDPLLDAVDILESNCRNAKNLLQRTRHVLTRLFFEFFPKKKNDMPAERLVDAFDTLEDPTLQLKRSSVNRGAEATVALSLSHGKKVDWSKVSSSQACVPSEIKKFFA
jgi:hypothetical protein